MFLCGDAFALPIVDDDDEGSFSLLCEKSASDDLPPGGVAGSVCGE